MSHSTVSPQDRGEWLFLSVVLVMTMMMVRLDTCSHAPSPAVRCHVPKDIIKEELHSFSWASLVLRPPYWRRGKVSGPRLAHQGCVAPVGTENACSRSGQQGPAWRSDFHFL